MSTPSGTTIFLEKLKNIQSMNWVDASVPYPNTYVINLSAEILQKIDAIGIMPANIGPSVEGGIGITFENKSKFAFLEIYNDKSACLLLDTNGQHRSVLELDTEDNLLLEKCLLKIKNHLIS